MPGPGRPPTYPALGRAPYPPRGSPRGPPYGAPCSPPCPAQPAGPPDAIGGTCCAGDTNSGPALSSSYWAIARSKRSFSLRRSLSAESNACTCLSRSGSIARHSSRSVVIWFSVSNDPSRIASYSVSRHLSILASSICGLAGSASGITSFSSCASMSNVTNDAGKYPSVPAALEPFHQLSSDLFVITTMSPAEKDSSPSSVPSNVYRHFAGRGRKPPEAPGDGAGAAIAVPPPPLASAADCDRASANSSSSFSFSWARRCSSSLFWAAGSTTTIETPIRSRSEMVVSIIWSWGS
mmetsp:Transcript_21495/g.56027  ORF Transcript_21495/g.56027 Transcript_21495/m.56027 type:complete len:294 (+) Transcript_21495:902-1783(+)